MTNKENKTEIICIRIKPSTRVKLNDKAETMSISPTQVARMIIENYFKIS